MVEGELGGPDRFERGARLAMEDGQQGLRGRIGEHASLFPVADRADRNVKGRREFGLGHGELAPDLANGKHEGEWRQSGVRVWLVFGRVSAAVVRGRRVEFGLVGGRAIGPQLRHGFTCDCHNLRSRGVRSAGADDPPGSVAIGEDDEEGVGADPSDRPPAGFASSRRPSVFSRVGPSTTSAG